MAHSSLKKMSGVQERKEGNYASLERLPCGRFTNSDLGLTLLPGSQIQRTDEKELGAAAKSSPRKAGSEFFEELGQPLPLENEIRAKSHTQTTVFPKEAESPSSSQNPGSESANLSHADVAVQTSRERSFSQYSYEPNANDDAASRYGIQGIDVEENKIANSIRHDDHSPRAVPDGYLESRTSNETRDLKVNQGKKAVIESHYNRSHAHYDQGLSKCNATDSGRRKQLSASIQLPISGSSKPVSYGQIKRSPDFTPLPPHQSLISRCENAASHGLSSAPPTLASRPPVKLQHPKADKRTVHSRRRNPSKASNQHSKHSRLLPPDPADVRAQVLKHRAEAKRSWTNHFPTKSKFLQRANSPTPSLLVALLTPSSHANLDFSSTPLSPSSLNLSLSKDLDNLLKVSTLEDIFNTVQTGNQRQPTRRRSASMPNLWSTRTPMNMDSSNKFGSASMPTPPREQSSSPAFLSHSSSLLQYGKASPRQNLGGSSHDPVNTYFQTNTSSSQYWQKVGTHNRENPALTSSLHTHQIAAQHFNNQDMGGPSMSKDGEKAADGLPHDRRHVEFKATYSYEEVKTITDNILNVARSLKAKNIALQSSNLAMKEGIKNLQHRRSESAQQIKRYERDISQKDRHIEALQQQGASLHQQYNEVRDNHEELVARLRKESGTDKPSAIIDKIRRNHVSDVVALASSRIVNEFPMSCANDAQASTWTHGLNQTHKGPVQPVLLPGYPVANAATACSPASVQSGSIFADHSSANSQHDQYTRWTQSNQPLDATVGVENTDLLNTNSPIGEVSTQLVTIDLTDDSQPPSSAASRDTSVHQARQFSVQGTNAPSSLLPNQFPLLHDPAGHFLSSQFPSSPSAQNPASQAQLSPNQDSQGTDIQAMQIQKDTFNRIAKKPLAWLQGNNPFQTRKRIGLQIGLRTSGRPLQSDPEGPIEFVESPEGDSAMPLMETPNFRKTKNEPSKKARVVQTSEAKSERAKVYRKRFADKQKEEKEVAKQLLQDEHRSNNSTRAQKQGRRAAKRGIRQEQARKPPGDFIPLEPQKTLDGRLYQEDKGIQQAVHQVYTGRAATDDDDSLFGDDESEEVETEKSDPSQEAINTLDEDAYAACTYIPELFLLFRVMLTPKSV